MFINSVITDAVMGLFAVFLPIFLYLILESIQGVILYYLASYILLLFFVFFLSHGLNSFSFRKALRLSALVGALFYLSFFFLDKDNYWFILPFSVIFISLWRFLYWIPYNVDLTKFTSKRNRGRQLGLIEVAFGITSILTPLIAGFIIEDFGFKALFFLAFLAFGLSFVPLIFTPRTKEKLSWSRKKIIKKILDKENRQAFLIFFADGAETVAGFLIWPIFIFLILGDDYLKIGSVLTMVVSVTVVMQLLAGKFIDKGCYREKMVKFGGVFYAIGWLAKIFVLSAFHIFVVDAFHKFTQIFYRTPLDVFVFEKAYEQKHLVDEFVVFREIGLCLGKIAMLALLLVSSFFVSINWLFVFGALFSLFLSLVYSKLHCSLR